MLYQPELSLVSVKSRIEYLYRALSVTESPSGLLAKRMHTPPPNAPPDQAAHVKPVPIAVVYK